MLAAESAASSRGAAGDVMWHWVSSVHDWSRLVMRTFGTAVGTLALGILFALGTSAAALVQAQDSHAAQDGPLQSRVAKVEAPQRPDEPKVTARNGMVASAQHLATKIGVDVLKQGGNAIDAAVAVGYALAVVHPCCGNIGGGGFMTVRLADGKVLFLDFREK
ncbi:MAG TPA: gamma-glutamyltransferase, partial [Rhodanobacter sp.]|nr:gamma-glutamyltransferase [Rhodanobacter sp.]